MDSPLNQMQAFVSFSLQWERHLNHIHSSVCNANNLIVQVSHHKVLLLIFFYLLLLYYTHGGGEEGMNWRRWRKRKEEERERKEEKGRKEERQNKITRGTNTKSDFWPVVS